MWSPFLIHVGISKYQKVHVYRGKRLIDAGESAAGKSSVDVLGSGKERVSCWLSVILDPCLDWAPSLLLCFTFFGLLVIREPSGKDSLKGSYVPWEAEWLGERSEVCAAAPASSCFYRPVSAAKKGVSFCGALFCLLLLDIPDTGAEVQDTRSMLCNWQLAVWQSLHCSSHRAQEITMPSASMARHAPPTMNIFITRPS